MPPKDRCRSALPRIVGLDDHPVVMEGTRAALAAHGYLCAWLGSATEPVELFRIIEAAEYPPDFALIDLHLKGPDTAERVIVALTGRGIRCIVFTGESRPEPLRRAVAAGAVGLILKSDGVERIAEVLRGVGEDGLSTSGELAYALLTDEAMCARLAPRQAQVLQLLAEGHTRREVARSFEPPLSESTVSTYLERVFQTYRLMGRPVRGTVDAVREAANDGHLDRAADRG